MSLDLLAGAVLSLGLTVFLVYALLRAEKF
jgi:K+-transporting ATPase KdpF subunit